jgi:hypothetical protein
MAALIFITSTGFVIEEHECLIKGKSISVFSQNHVCNSCKKTKSTVTTSKLSIKRNSCCSTKSTYKHLTFNAHSSKSQCFASELVGVIFESNLFLCNQNSMIVQPKLHLLPLAKAPPISRKLRIQLNQTFII